MRERERERERDERERERERERDTKSLSLVNNYSIIGSICLREITENMTLLTVKLIMVQHGVLPIIVIDKPTNEIHFHDLKKKEELSICS